MGDTKSLGHDPLSARCRTGVAIGKGRGDVTIMVKNSYRSKTFINKEILRQALIQNIEYIKDALGVAVVDLRKNVAPEVDAPVEKKGEDNVINVSVENLPEEEPKPKPKKEIGLIDKEGIVEPTVFSYESLTIAELRAELDKRGVEYLKKMNKTQLLELIRQ